MICSIVIYQFEIGCREEQQNLKMTLLVSFLLLSLTFAGFCGGQEAEEAETSPLFKNIRLPILNIGISKPTFRKTVVRKNVHNK